MKISPSKSMAVLAALACLHAYAAPADMRSMNMGMDEPKAAGKPKAVLAEGEVKAVDRAGNTITLKHGRIKSKTVEMGPMTMMFPVSSASLLTPSIKEGNKVQFQVENMDGTPTVVLLKKKP
jgi:Cu(I)/Ag(I) efflux system protein CusF